MFPYGISPIDISEVRDYTMYMTNILQIKHLTKAMFIHALNSIDVQNNFHQSMCIRKENYSNRMLYFSQDLNQQRRTMAINICFRLQMFSQMAWVYPIKQNKFAVVMDCFKDILRKCGEPPERLNTDQGSELICTKFTAKNSLLFKLQFKKMSYCRTL